MDTLKQKLEDLRQTIHGTKEKILEIGAILDEEKLPDSEKIDNLVEKFHEAINTETTILSRFSELGSNAEKGSIPEYADWINKFSSANTIALWLQALDKFTRIHSNDSNYDEALEEYRNKASIFIEKLKSFADHNKTVELQEEISVYLDIVNIVESEAISNEDPRLDNISDKIASPKIYRGLTIGKYQIDAVANQKTDALPLKTPVDAEYPKNCTVTENGLKIIVNKNIKVEGDIFRKHLEKYSGYASAILGCSTWLIYYTATEMERLLKIFKKEYSETDCADALDYLVDKGYLVSFQTADQNMIRYALCQNIKNALANSQILKILRSAGSVDIAMKGYSKNITSVSGAEVYAIEERNKAFLDAVDYVCKTNGAEAAKETIVDPLSCNIYCYYIEKSNIAIVSKTMLFKSGENEKEDSLAGFLRKNTNLILLLSDVNSPEEAETLVSSLLPGRKWQTLPLFYPRDAGAAIDSAFSDVKPEDTEPMPATEPGVDRESLWNMKDSPALEPVSEGIASEILPQTLEKIANEIADFDVQNNDEKYFHSLCDRLIDSLINNFSQTEAGDTDISPDRIIQVLVFLYALSQGKYKETYKNKSIQFQLATEFRLDDIRYDSETLGNAFPDNSELHLKISAWIRAMFSPDSKQDYALYTLGDQLADQLEKYPPPLKKVLKHLVSLRSTTNGFSPAVLDKFADQTTKQKTSKNMAQRAAVLKKGPTIRARLNGIKEFTELCFGTRGNLYQAMTAIENSDESMAEIVQSIVKDIEDPTIDRYIDDAWKQVKSRGDVTLPRLENAARQQAFGYIERQMNLMKEWLEYTGRNKTNISPEIERLRNTLLNELPNAINSIADGQLGSTIICNALEYIHRSLRDGKVPDVTWIFIEFLYSNEINLNEDNRPNFPAFFESLYGMEAWRSIARHIAEPRIPLDDVLVRIKNKKDKYYFDNISQGQKIELFLTTNGQLKTEGMIPWGKYEELAKSSALDSENKLFAEMELAFAYGRIEEQEKERLLLLEKQFKEYFFDNHNYGHFRFVLSLFSRLLEQQKNIIGDKLKKQFTNSLAKPNMDRECALAKEIEKLLQNANFNVAEEYINRLDSGKQELPADGSAEESDFFGEFLEKWDDFNKICQRNKGKSLKNWAPENFLLNPAWTHRQRESSRNLLSNWIAKKSDVTEINIRTFFDELGFSVEKVEKEKSELHLVFALQVKPPDLNQPDYRHPIAAFGTKIAQPVHIICLFGSYAVADLIDIIVNQLHLGDNSIVLCDNAVSLEDRRKIVEDFHKKTSGQNSFLFIDQVLALYLATLDRGERMPAMLKCTLPYTYCQPFSSGSGTIPDEMFFGRKTELEDILSDTGTNIVYGGRQLGKTALLLRARSIIHKPDYKEYAVYTEVKGKTPGEALIMIYREMQVAKIPIMIPDITAWEDLCQRIHHFFNKGTIKKLLLLIDEADMFFENDEKNTFKVIGLLINLSRQTRNRFKFVFAGLHDVARSKNAIEKNGVFPQMPKPLCIHPLSPTDARNLLKRPLSYLGFRMDHLQQLELILANTNYYPGILHFFGHILIKTVLSEQYGNYYSADKNPPYDLSDEQLRKIFSDNRLNKAIKEKIDITLSLDTRYKILANVIAYRYYLDERDVTDKSKGYSAGNIRDTALELGIKPEGNLSLTEVTNLLSEMADMGILWRNDDESLFRLRRSSFLGTIGTWEQVDEYISGLGEQGFSS